MYDCGWEDCDKAKESLLVVSLVEEKNENVVFSNEILLEAMDEGTTWYAVIDETIDVIPGEKYRIDIKNKTDMNDCVAIYMSNIYDEKNAIEINGTEQEGALALKIKVKS